MNATRLTTEATPPPCHPSPGSTSRPGPGKDVVGGGIKGQRAPAVADAWKRRECWSGHYCP